MTEPIELEPTITLPLSEFLSILWGYKKSDLRDRAVPGDSVVALLAAIPNIDKYVYIQKQEGCQTQVWQIQEWKRSGFPTEQLRTKMEKHSNDADTVFRALKGSRIGILDVNILRTIAHQIVSLGDYTAVEALGIKREELGL